MFTSSRAYDRMSLRECFVSRGSQFSPKHHANGLISAPLARTTTYATVPYLKTCATSTLTRINRDCVFKVLAVNTKTTYIYSASAALQRRLSS